LELRQQTKDATCQEINRSLSHSDYVKQSSNSDSHLAATGMSYYSIGFRKVMETCSDVLLFLHCFQINDCDHVCPFKNKIVEGALSGSNSDLDSKFSSHLVFLWPF
jgi:hypothetical protein